MRPKGVLLTLLALGVLGSAGAQNKLLYSGTFTGPYSANSTATLEIWGFDGDKAQERVNYPFQGDRTEVNTVRIDFGSTITAKWKLSGVPTPPTVQGVYQALTGNLVGSLPTTPLS